MQETNRLKMSYFNPVFILYFVLLGISFAKSENKVYCKRNSACLESIFLDIEKVLMSPTNGIVRPFYIDSLDAKLLTMSYKLYNTTVTGIERCKINNLRSNVKTLFLAFDYRCPKNLKVVGDYETSGKLFDWNIAGKGDYDISLGAFITTIQMNLEEKKNKDGTNYFRIQTYKTNATVTSTFHVKINNLFEGQKGLSESFHKFVHDNWKPVAEFIQGPINEGSWKRILGHVNRLLKTVPIVN